MEVFNLRCEGLFLHVDAEFDVPDFRNLCEGKGTTHNNDINKRRAKMPRHDINYLLDNQIYKKRFCVEQLNAWVDGFKTLRIRYETKAFNWMALHAIAFSIVFLINFNIVNI